MRMKKRAAATDPELDPHDHPVRRPRPGRATDADLERAAALFRALADPARLRLLELLTDGEACVSELAAATGDGLSTTSQRLKLLRAEALVARRRAGKHIHYALADRHVTEIVRGVLDHVKE